MSPFDHESLWNKSKIFVDRALRARDNDESRDFFIFTAVALELLGKAALAAVHPSLVANPNDFKGLLAACQNTTASGSKSIMAKTVYERLRIMVDDFDERMKRECLLMAERRNAELHSGDTPTEGLDSRAWVPVFWRAANVIVEAQGRTLEDWLGRNEAERVSRVLQDTAEVVRQATLSRIERRRAEYAERYPVGSPERRLAYQTAVPRAMPSSYQGRGDAHEVHPCPACGTTGWLFGFEREQELLDPEEDEEYGYVEVVKTTFAVEEFRCPECGLRIEGLEEIAAAGLLESFEEEEVLEPHYEEEYNNE